MKNKLIALLLFSMSGKFLISSQPPAKVIKVINAENFQDLAQGPVRDAALTILENAQSCGIFTRGDVTGLLVRVNPAANLSVPNQNENFIIEMSVVYEVNGEVAFKPLDLPGFCHQ